MNHTAQKIPVGISQCLLGDNVCFDGGHKHSSLCTGQLAQLFDYVAVCPEVAIGLGTPRKTLRLMQENDTIIAVQPASQLDVSKPLSDYGKQIAESNPQLCGFIFMAKSPSCGLFRSKIYNQHNQVIDHGMGVFARQICQHNPLLPVEEAGRLNDAVLKDNFVIRVQAYQQWQQLLRDNPDNIAIADITDYYARYKYLLMAHDQANYRAIGQLLANSKGESPQQVGEQVFQLLMRSLQKTAGRKQHTNVLMHIRGYFKKQLSAQQHQELNSVIEHYYHGHVPLAVPLTLLRHYLMLFPNRYLAQQAYLYPYPDQLGIRSHI